MSTRSASRAVAGMLLAGVSSFAPAWAQAPAPFQTNWSIQAINAPAAYAAGFDGTGSLIAIIDDGFDLTHPAFAGKIVEALNTGGVGPMPVMLHGTHVAGIASGIAYGADLSLYTYGSLLNNAAAFQAAAARRPAVISNSWGTDVDVNDILNRPSFLTNPYLALSEVLGNTPADHETFTNALLAAQRHSVILFAASNDPTLPDVDISAAMPLVIPELQKAWIAVVNVDRDGNVVSVTCGSAAQFCLAGPGVDILSAEPGGGYRTLSGTSMATPHVAGAVAIARQIYPAATPAQLTSLVLQSATDAGAPGVDPVYGWGYLNVGNLLQTNQPSTASSFANASVSRFSALHHVGSAIPLARFGGAPSAGAARGGRAAYASLGVENDGASLTLDGSAVRSVWANALYGYSDLAGAGGSPGAESRTVGFLVGADLFTGPSHRVGVAGGLSWTDIDSDARGDSAETDGVHLLLYGDWKRDGFFASGVGQLAFFDESMVRSNIAGAAGAAVTPIGRSTTSSWAAELSLRAGFAFAAQGFEIAPYVAAAARRQEADSFAETGAGIFSLTVAGATHQQLEFGPGIRVTSPELALESVSVRASLDVAYAHLSGDRATETSATLLGTTIRTRSAEVGEHVLKVGSDLEVTGKGGRTSGILSYDGRFQDNVEAHAFSAELRLAF